MIDMSKMRTVTSKDFNKRHSKTLYRSICVPSTTQSYSLCIEFMKNWFLNKFPEDTFKFVYIDGKNVYDDFRKMSKTDFLKRTNPSLIITPSVDWEFNDDNVDSYPYGMDLYTQTGKFKNSFLSCPSTNSYMGIGLETLLMNFNFKFKVESRAQQLDMYKFVKLACRVGFTCGQDLDLDFHVPYALMVQIAKDNGFKTYQKDKDSLSNSTEVIRNTPEFLRWLNMHSTLPFLYKHRTLNGRNEFFIRMRNMYVHIRPTELSADDGNRVGQLDTDFSIELNCEVRFPAPKMYAYYSDNAHKLQTVYGTWTQPNGPITTCYTFKGINIPDENRYGWPIYLNTTYEDDNPDVINNFIIIDFSELLENDVGACILDCLKKAISPSIFCDIIFYNGGEYIDGKFDWESLKFTSTDRVRSPNTYIGIYCDKDFLADFILQKNKGYESRIQNSKNE